jgi:hypothetical protein
LASVLADGASLLLGENERLDPTLDGMSAPNKFESADHVNDPSDAMRISERMSRIPGVVQKQPFLGHKVERNLPAHGGGMLTWDGVMACEE